MENYDDWTIDELKTTVERCKDEGWYKEAAFYQQLINDRIENDTRSRT